jgi:polypeptide N-acetylgalactosaminyltransferase
MAPRRRGLLKYLVLIPIIWFLTILTFSLRTDSSLDSRSNKDISINVVQRMVSFPSFVERIKNALSFPQLHVDHDHPPEERLKARRQAEEMNAQVQVVAPEVDHHRNLSWPGEMGNAVRIKKDKLSDEERRKYDEGWKDNAFNQYASDMISLRRSLADVRDPE